MIEPSQNDEWDIIIVGGGINGLALGALLSHDNLRVLILEKEDYLGGRNRVTKKDGFVLDYGLHLLRYGWKSPLNEVLRAIKDENYERLYIHPIRTNFLYVGDEIKNFKPNKADKKELKWFNRGWIRVPRNMNEMRKNNYFSLWKLMRIFTTGLKCDYEDTKGLSLREFLDKNKINDIAARYMKLASGVLTRCPYTSITSAGEVCRHIKWTANQPILFGYPSGGWCSIIRRLVKEIEKNGKIIKNCSVTRLDLEKLEKRENSNEIDEVTTNNNIEMPDYYISKGVFTNLGEYKSKMVVLAVPPKSLPPLFLDSSNNSVLDNDLLHFIENVVPTAGITFDFALKKVVYGGNSFLYTENPNGYGIFISNLDNSLAPKGKQLFSVFVPLSPTKIHQSEYVEKYKNAARKQILSLFPKIESEVLFERVLVHKIVDSVQVNIDQYKDVRPSPSIKGIKNCFLTGDYLNTFGSGGELGYNAIWKTYSLIKIEEAKSKKLKLESDIIQ